LWSCEKQGLNLQLSNLMLGKEIDYWGGIVIKEQP
jgi:hypothetical protein